MYRWADTVGPGETQPTKTTASSSDAASDVQPEAESSSNNSGSTASGSSTGSSNGRPGSAARSSSSSSSSGDDDNINTGNYVAQPSSRSDSGSSLAKPTDEDAVMNDTLLPDTDAFGASWLDPNAWSGTEMLENLGPASQLDFSSVLEHSIDPNIRHQDVDIDYSNHQRHPPRWRERSHSAFCGSTSSLPDLSTDHVTSISQLSQLTMRLSQLYRSNESLNETVRMSYRRGSVGHDGHVRSPLVDDGVFKLVSAWLSYLSSKATPQTSIDPPTSPDDGADVLGVVLCGVFTASGDLLEILRGLMPPSDPWSAAPAHHGNMNSNFNSLTTAPNGATCQPKPQHQHQKHRVRTASVSSQAISQSPVTSHLLLACHTMLLTIYNFVLIALESDVDLCCLNTASLSSPPADLMLGTSLGSTRSSSSGGFGLGGHPCGGPCGGIGPLSNIRLVMVVQLCSYLINQQHQSITTYLSGVAAPRDGQFFSSSPLRNTSASWEQMSINGDYKSVTQLMSDIQARMNRLLKSLGV
ncbi:uncharacterized protein B0I36DRAFT_354240 [Microdochium trichocladiopsis]|uniref:Uncharacterized protein n=1 Tax=Microdochium trichocladiopsis TaxID=1682393 RepID=A0A9P8XZ03_9PEZI|nr:uncharacterized protein B0I36DRAFT_354240 [Microdochium trichocladiopsis]KAH7021615.1 hypothetical protein B0I36DRAFT_354240 [Microdochium trichocladiopsis]